MAGSLSQSMFYDVLYPAQDGKELDQDFSLRRQKTFLPSDSLEIRNTNIILFDFETTGLDFRQDRIIEVGALKIKGELLHSVLGSAVDLYTPEGKINPSHYETYEALLDTDVPISQEITQITGITKEMVAGKPRMEDILQDFLNFISGSILVAHNAEFDLGMLKASCGRSGIDLEWPSICTVKMSRQLLPDLENHKLDTLAKHFNLSFSARHRSIGDAEVNLAVLINMLKDASQLRRLADFSPFRV